MSSKKLCGPFICVWGQEFAESQIKCWMLACAHAALGAWGKVGRWNSVCILHFHSPRGATSLLSAIYMLTAFLQFHIDCIAVRPTRAALHVQIKREYVADVRTLFSLRQELIKPDTRWSSSCCLCKRWEETEHLNGRPGLHVIRSTCSLFYGFLLRFHSHISDLPESWVRCKTKELMIKQREGSVTI